MKDSRHTLGRWAERLVSDRLRTEGFVIVGANVRVGRLELDLIAQRGGLIVFCEVRARTRSEWIHPADTVDFRKIKRVRLAATRWLANEKRRATALRFDVAAVTLKEGSAAIEYYENAF